MLLLRALLGAIEETIAWVLDLFKNYYNVRVPYKDDAEFGPQVYLKITVIFVAISLNFQLSKVIYRSGTFTGGSTLEVLI